jgi:hypothetical protein
MSRSARAVRVNDAFRTCPTAGRIAEARMVEDEAEGTILLTPE